MRSSTATSELLDAAREFFDEPEVADATSAGRRAEVFEAIRGTGSYEHTAEELLLGARIAWRNHARCVGRASWQALELIDARHCRSAAEVAGACWEHLRSSTNSGALRAMITVFRPAPSAAVGGGEGGGGGEGVEILNPQLVRYAGYERPDGTVVGDPLHVRLTELALRLGWRGKGTHFDVLPLMLRVDGGPIQWFEVPDDAVLEVPIVHPHYAWFGDLGLRWHANPAISNMTLSIGGLSYVAAPFSGWYVSSEIGARNFGDVDRYDRLRAVASRMGLDTSRNDTLWRDRALVELNAAVLHSYRTAGVHIVDHHTSASQFARHVDRERALGRQVPADWAWVIPPMSPSTTAVWNHDYDPPDFDLRPNFVARRSPVPGALAAAGPVDRCPFPR